MAERVKMMYRPDLPGFQSLAGLCISVYRFAVQKNFSNTGIVSLRIRSMCRNVGLISKITTQSDIGGGCSWP